MQIFPPLSLSLSAHNFPSSFSSFLRRFSSRLEISFRFIEFQEFLANFEDKEIKSFRLL